MACIPCQKARAALGSAFRSLASGDVQSAKANTTVLRDALAEKAESLRVRALTRRS
jgi:hypothetical protein